jgi:hypothetical protein
MPSHYGKGRSKMPRPFEPGMIGKAAQRLTARASRALAAQKRKKVGAPGVSGEAPELKAHGVKPSK